MTHDDTEDHDRGLGFDLETLTRRRSVLGILGLGAAGGAGLAGVLASGGGSDAVDATAASTLAARPGCSTVIPEETAGPYPGDGSNGPDVLTESGIVRSDIRRSFGSATAQARGVPLRITFTLERVSTCTPVKGLAVYAWHCTRAGEYSMYSADIADQNYLRGVQVTNGKGRASFTSIYPGCYSGRWPHIHFEVYADRSAATNGGTPIATSQIAMPRQASMHVYRNAKGYSASVTNLDQVSLSSDDVFGNEGGIHQLGTVTGSIADGYHVQLVVPVSP
jgi:protocatechuate 3,4-dioxygenase beta subunit